MANFVLAYRGGGMPETPEEGQKVMEAWMSWFGALGAAVVDGGNPFGPARTVATDGSVHEGGSAALSGYSIISADDLAGAVERAKGCPILTSGGSVDVYEVMPMD